VLFKKTVQDVRFADAEFTRDDASVVYTKHGIDVFHALCSDVCELLDLGGGVLDLLVRHRELELFDTTLDGVPTGQTVTNGHVSGETKVFGLEDFVGAWVVEDGFGVDAGLVRERAVASDGVAEGDSDFDGLSDQVLDLAKHREVVLGLDVFRVGGVQAGDEAS